MPDAIPASSSTTHSLATDGTAASSAIDTAGDRDWWRVRLAVGFTYTFRMNKRVATS